MTRSRWAETGFHHNQTKELHCWDCTFFAFATFIDSQSDLQCMGNAHQTMRWKDDFLLCALTDSLIHCRLEEKLRFSFAQRQFCTFLFYVFVTLYYYYLKWPNAQSLVYLKHTSFRKWKLDKIIVHLGNKRENAKTKDTTIILMIIILCFTSFMQSEKRRMFFHSVIHARTMNIQPVNKNYCTCWRWIFPSRQYLFAV